MSVKHQIRRGVGAADRRISKWYLETIGDKPAVLSFLFHTVFDDKEEMSQDLLDPQQALCLDDYRFVFERFLEMDFQFVDSQQIMQGLEPDKSYVNVTFDDGYRNNFKILPLLDEYQIPIDLFVTTDNVKNQESFCYDVVYRRRREQGRSLDEVRLEQQSLKVMAHSEILRYLDREFGPDCLTPVGDLDRPMTPDEVIEISKNPWVRIGNHTSNHRLLSKYTDEVVEREVFDCQRDLESWIGYAPKTFAYPNGDYDRRLFPILMRNGIEYAVTCDWRKIEPATWAVRTNEPYRLGRFCFLGPENLDDQINMFRNPYSPFVLAKNAVHGIRAAKDGRRSK